MVERNLIINGRELKYRGVFRVDELFGVVNRALEDKGYTKKEKRSEEIVTERGRRTFVELRPHKFFSEDVNLMIKLRITLDNVTETTERVEGIKKRFQQGDVLIIFDAWLITKYEMRWDKHPWLFFVRGLVNKYFYKLPAERKQMATLYEDTAYFFDQVLQLLSSYKIKLGKKPVSDREVQKSVEEDIAREMF